MTEPPTTMTGEHEMAPRKVVRLQKPARVGVGVEEVPLAEPLDVFGQQKPKEKGRFRLQVDRQTKAAYTTLEAAEAAGLAIKRGFPILYVSVFDADEGKSITIAAPEA